MIESKSFGSKAFKVINAIILILLAFSCFYPLWYTFCVSISSKAAAEGGLVTIYPIGSNVKSYSLIMGDSAFWNSFWISIDTIYIVGFVKGMSGKRIAVRIPSPAVKRPAFKQHDGDINAVLACFDYPVSKALEICCIKFVEVVHWVIP